eukprot:6299961-Amphidinium_carterae.1
MELLSAPRGPTRSYWARHPIRWFIPPSLGPKSLCRVNLAAFTARRVCMCACLRVCAPRPYVKQTSITNVANYCKSKTCATFFCIRWFVGASVRLLILDCDCALRILLYHLVETHISDNDLESKLCSFALSSTEHVQLHSPKDFSFGTQHG